MPWPGYSQGICQWQNYSYNQQETSPCNAVLRVLFNIEKDRVNQQETSPCDAALRFASAVEVTVED